jgi:hypothetical protein
MVGLGITLIVIGAVLMLLSAGELGGFLLLIGVVIAVIGAVAGR